MSFEYKLPQFPEPFWRRTTKLPSFQRLQSDMSSDVVIVGGGITGLTTAYQLVKQGIGVIVLDSGKLLNGTTGHTTAKITAQHGLIYDEFIQHFGEEKAKQYYQSNSEALRFITNVTKELQIDCDLIQDDAYIYTKDESYISQIEKEAHAYERLGVAGGLVSSMPLEIEIKRALMMKQQAQFHPLKYFQTLIQSVMENGGKFFENTTVSDIEKGTRPTVVTKDGHKVSCNYVVVSSHYPFYDGKGFYFTRMYSERSYLMAVRTKKKYPGGMYINAEQPTRSLRYTPYNGDNLVIIGGENHKTGHGTNTIEHYEELATYGDTLFGIEEIVNRWSAQDLTTLDKLPYIGKITDNAENIFVATGYRKWGMTNGTLAGLLISDLIAKGSNPYQDLYSPSRFYSDPSVKTFVKQNADVAGHFVAGKLGIIQRTVDDIQTNEGAVVKVNGQRAGCYKDVNGKLHIVDTTCTHMGCELEWNNGERSWDCPCHGSRFSYEGKVMEGPANKPLKKIDLD